MMEREPPIEPPRSQLLMDERYPYRGYHGDAICRLRIYDRFEHAPLVIATELPDNPGTSITNMAEYLAWEVGSRLLGGRIEAEHPFDWVEHVRPVTEQWIAA